MLPNAEADWLPKAGAGLEDRKPPSVVQNPPLGPLETAGAAPYPLEAGALDAPNVKTGWAVVDAGALVAGACLDASKENADVAGADDTESNVVEGAPLDLLPKPPTFDPDPNTLDELDPKAVDVEPKLDVVAGA